MKVLTKKNNNLNRTLHLLSNRFLTQKINLTKQNVLYQKEPLQLNQIDILNQKIRTTLNSHVPKIESILTESPKITKHVIQIQNSTGIILKPDYIAKLVKNLIEEKVLLKKKEEMDCNFSDPSDLFDIDDFTFNEQLLFDATSPDSAELLDGVVNVDELELFPELQEEHQEDIEIPDLSDLPFEDFVNIDSYINELDNITDCEVSSGFNACSPETNSDYCVGNFSEQSSPEIDQETQAEYKELLDSINENDFLSTVHYNPTESSLVINSSSVIEEDLSFNSSTSTYINDDSPCASSNEVTDDILAMLNELYGVSHDLTEENIVEKCAFKRIRDTSVEDAVVTKKKRVDDYSVPPSPALSVWSDTSDSGKTTLRRVKNNEASRVTRAKRKAKHSGLFQKEVELTKDNAQMKIQIESMQKEADLLRKLLLSKLSGNQQ